MIMKETIGIILTELASKHVEFYFSEAQTEEYPYAVYTCSPSPVYTKDGIHHYEADVRVTVYDKVLDRANSIAESIMADIASGMNGDQYASRMVSDATDCSDEVWSREMIFTIKQYR